MPGAMLSLRGAFSNFNNCVTITSLCIRLYYYCSPNIFISHFIVILAITSLLLSSFLLCLLCYINFSLLIVFDLHKISVQIVSAILILPYLLLILLLLFFILSCLKLHAHFQLYRRYEIKKATHLYYSISRRLLAKIEIKQNTKMISEYQHP